ncbi:MAG: 5'-nucleotidase [Planctomycetota bacterium]
MPFDLRKKFVVGIASRSLFDMAREHQHYIEHGPESYRAHQIANESKPLSPGTSFELVQKFLGMNQHLPSERQVQVIVMSRNQPDAGRRICNSVRAYNLDISRFCFTGGRPVAQYLRAFSVDLFLSAESDDVRNAFIANYPAALTYGTPSQPIERGDPEIRVAFDGDGVLFGDEAERINQGQGLAEFHAHEVMNAHRPLPEGPFAKLLFSLWYLQQRMESPTPLIRTALVTARNAPAESRVFETLRQWGVRIDESFYLGGSAKVEVLRAFAPDIFFDDQADHCRRAACEVPTAQVPSNLFTLSATSTPLCPICGAAMAHRISRRGPHAGKPFWGCSNYSITGCRGLVPMA